ncbi:MULTISPECIES: DUF481 domain-containing protein [Lysobacter]|uniref:DUF481 domain-containing protein n=1 Tax=Lysobacter gummosus TaxID=262324 RepID=A0ABY3X8H7_9GAMM|nr:MULTISPECIES: DUF481 domain-containing protein [Lysobacter]ALN93431.1 hypothetical protein LG3211_4497 [Lysobacter gummosus]UJB19866.1 DUF481 domain-containing protein [Lysobacter capsici]UJQ26408.1 DUF481 domain-containing protein [Lysobacter gummosus]UNP28892.1 DUF481 domain-containing protein [Lysobacter gummosus]
MLGAIGLALLGAPLITLPTPAFGGDPILIAIASDPVQLRLHCFSTRCGDEEWKAAMAPTRRDPVIDPADLPPLRKVALPGQQRVIGGVSAPATSRESRALYSNDYRVGTRYGVQALRDGPTQIGLSFGAGYRLAPLADDGINRPGAVFRGELNLGQRISDRARWTQRVQIESGRGDTFVKQSVRLDVDVWQNWKLETDFAIRHDNRGGGGSESAESSIELIRRF